MMMLSRDDVLQQALALPPIDQAYVADVLERRLAKGPCTSSDIGEAWSNEINLRMTAFDRGESSAIDFEKSLEHLQQAIAERRSRQVTP